MGYSQYSLCTHISMDFILAFNLFPPFRFDMDILHTKFYRFLVSLAFGFYQDEKKYANVC